MKKIYLQPMVEETALVSIEMIAASLRVNRNSQGEDEIYDETVLLSRNIKSVWDED